MAKKSLENFIKSYINKRSAAKSEEEYNAFARKNGINSTQRLARDLLTADTDFKKSLAGYGKKGEQLGSLGLTKSGYASFVNESANNLLKKRIVAADENYRAQELKGRKGYSDYLKAITEKETKENERLFKEVKSKLSEQGLTNYEEAYSLASEMGLSEKDADALAKESTEKAVRAARLKVISAIVNKRYSGKQAKEYATALGLSEELASELSELAESTNREIDLGKAEGYLEYLKALDKEKRAEE